MKQKVIFGTGEIAKKIYTQFKSEGVQIAFFLDSLLEKNSFMERPVYSPNYLEKLENVNDYEYYLGTYTSSKGMSGELIKHGVNVENIHITKDYCIHTLENDIKTINNDSKFILYPKFDSQEEFDKVIEDFVYCFPRYKNSQIEIHICGQIKTSDNNIIVDNEFYNLDESVVLVWNKEHLYDNKIKEVLRKLCIDPDYFYISNVRILNRLNKMLWNEDEICDLKKKSIDNYKKLEECKYNEAYVYGNGPSCAEGIEKVKLENTFRVACNQFIGSDEYMLKLKPTMYVISDEVFTKCNLSEWLEKIVNYVLNNDCYLCTNLEMALNISDRYPDVVSKLIFIELSASQITFPTSQNCCVLRKSFNVMTALVIPIASSLANEINIAGCDGRPMEHELKPWKYDEKLNYKIEKYYSSSEDKWFIDDYKKHVKYFEEIIRYGQMKGKIYKSISFSYIPVLRELEENK